MKKRLFFRLHLLRGPAPFQLLSLCIFSLISFGKRPCKILFFWVSAVSWQYKLDVCNIFVNCLGESCKLLCELVSLSADCWMLRKCAKESKSIRELTQGVHIALWCIKRHGERLLFAWDLPFLVCEVFMAMYVCECVNAHLRVCNVFLHFKLLWV